MAWQGLIGHVLYYVCVQTTINRIYPLRSPRNGMDMDFGTQIMCVICVVALYLLTFRMGSTWGVEYNDFDIDHAQWDLRIFA